MKRHCEKIVWGEPRERGHCLPPGRMCPLLPGSLLKLNFPLWMSVQFNERERHLHRLPFLKRGASDNVWIDC